MSRFLSLLLFYCCVYKTTVNAVPSIQYTPIRVAAIMDPTTYPALTQYVPGWWQEYITSQGGVSGSFPLVLTQIRSAGPATTGWATNVTQALIQNGTDVVVMLALDNIVLAAALLLQPAGIPLIVPAAPSAALFACPPTNWKSAAPCIGPNTRRFQVAHSIMASATNYMEPFLSLLRIRGGRSVAFLTASSSVSAPGVIVPSIYDEFSSGTASIATDNNIKFYSVPVRFPAPLSSELAGITQQLQALQVDAVIGMYSCELFLPYWKSINFNVNAISFSRCIDAFFPPSTDPGDTMQFVTAPTQWDYRLKGADYAESSTGVVHWFPVQQSNITTTGTSPTISPSLLSAQQFQALCLSRTNIAPDGATASFAAAFEFLGAGVSNWLLQSLASVNMSSNSNVTITLDYSTFNRQLQLVYEPSFFGLLSTNRYGQNQQKEMAYLQRTSLNQNQIISPVAAATMDFVYPMPTWAERIYVHSMYATTEELIINIMIILCIVYTLCLCGMMCYHRHSRHIRATSLNFSLIMAFGSMAGYVAILTWPIENNTTTCTSRAWIWGLAFQLFFAPLLAKSYRIARIFQMEKLQKTKHDDHLVFKHMIAIALPQILILMIWTIVSPMQVIIRVVDPLRPLYNYTDCDSSSSIVWIWLSVAYAALCLIVGCVLAFRVRVSFELFNDARYIANSVYIFTLTALIIASVQASSGPTQYKSIFVIRSIGTIIAYCSSCSLLLLPRVLGVITHETTSTTYQPTKHESSNIGPEGVGASSGARHSSIGIKVPNTVHHINGRKSSFPSVPENQSSHGIEMEQPTTTTPTAIEQASLMNGMRRSSVSPDHHSSFRNSMSMNTASPSQKPSTKVAFA